MSGRKDESPSPTDRQRSSDSQRVREPVAAGMFYPSEAEACRSAADAYVAMWRDRFESGAGDLHERQIGGIVPHAGWVCSGAIAGQTIGTIAASRRREPPTMPSTAVSGLPHRPDDASAAVLTEFDSRSDTAGERGAHDAPDVVIVLGAVHTPLPIRVAALDDYERWVVPGSASPVLAELRAKLLAETRRMHRSRELFAVDDRFHRGEHAIEVELPLIAAAWPTSAIVPVEVPTIDRATSIGREIARLVGAMQLDAVILASSDLTHYGPAYRFAPAGVGLDGLRWAQENDRRLLERIERLEVEGIVAEVEANSNACGGGAIAAMLAACRELGAQEARVLQHANSYETLAVIEPQPPDNAVGYASVIVG
jgi:AmmeMemoRadiSam system protein B